MATLAFALVTSSWLLRQDWAFGAGASTRPITLLGSELETSRGYYYVALGSFVVVATLATIVRQSSIGRHLIAVRDNDNAARVFQIASRRTLLGTYALAGAIAGVGGSVLAFNNTFVSRAIFTPSASVDVVAIAVVGGLGELMGPLLGAAYLIGIPEFFDLELSALAGLNAAWLILILEQPRGLVGLFSSTKRHVIDAIARLHGVTVTDDIEPVATPATSALSLQPAVSTPSRPVRSAASRGHHTHPKLRRSDGSRQRYVQGCKGRDTRTHRSERGGKDDVVRGSSVASSSPT